MPKISYCVMVQQVQLFWLENAQVVWAYLCKDLHLLQDSSSVLEYHLLIHKVKALILLLLI